MPSNLARYFDAVIPWEKRLRREMPLLSELARAAGRHVLLPACGTGGHAMALAAQGFHVCGFDVDEDALALARAKLAARQEAIRAAHGEVRLAMLALEHAHELGPVHDAAFCLGNALPGLSEPGQIAAALRGIAGALRPGGIFLTQNLNYDRRWREKSRFFPVLSGETSEEEVLLVKFADYEAEFLNFHAMFLTRPKRGGAWKSEVRTSRQIPLFRDRLAEQLHEAGFVNLRCWGDYTPSPFDPQSSNDLIAVAEKA
jgi:SAM-dependent methyltransferase